MINLLTGRDLLNINMSLMITRVLSGFLIDYNVFLVISYVFDWT